MKVKILILFALLLQLCFIFVLVPLVPDVSELIGVGIEHLKAACVSEAPTNSKTVEGYSILKTSGDFFAAALRTYRIQTAMTFIVVVINILLLVCLLIILRKKRADSYSDISRIDESPSQL